MPTATHYPSSLNLKRFDWNKKK